jgi:ABC-type sugar transport system substrate-binding protein
LTKKKIDVIYLMLAHPVSMNWKKGMEDENLKYGFTLNHYDTNFNAQVMNDMVDASIARKVDLIIYSPPDPASGGPPCIRAQEANIPILNFLNPSIVSPDFTVIPDPYAMGIESTEILLKALNYKGKVAVVVGDRVTLSAMGRAQGFVDTCAKYPDVEVVANVDTPTGPWSRQGAYDSMKGVLMANPDLSGVFVGDDEMAQGAIQAIKEAGKEDQVLVTGLGGERSGLQAIKDGTMVGTSWYSPYLMGKDLISIAALILSSPGYKAGTLQGVKWTDNVAVTKDNVDDVLWPPAG